MTRATPIDVWDIASYDRELREDLDVHAEDIRNFMDTSRRHWLEREASDHTMPYSENPYSGIFMAISDHVGRLMGERTIRAWHYTRMTDAEVAALRRDGVHLSTMDSLRARLAAQVAAGTFDAATAERLLAGSPFHHDILGSRANKFWMVSHPHESDDSGVELLLESWGGEAVYFWQRDPELQALLRTIGRPRVLEFAVPMIKTWSSSAAGAAVIAAYGRSLGCRYDSKMFDLYAHQPLGAECRLAVHSDGDTNFAGLGRTYPASYRCNYGDS
ncbi:hypothetical protein [Sphingomonas baiyangensis]|uniref:Uncharacterized protein n=1 Tax=Sphingomonas baiyangensis TaxID=2572576 RepID=A0A4U1L3F3_9SPHN|nr:hypothetical protein [Sphingomonas baiyangensis]TKD51431.1 hypothetical protein FBR43_12225 [Sphingomonas baiyangensis]